MNDSTSRADALSGSAILPGSGERSKYGRWPDTNRFVIGVLPGEGVGSELISVVRDLLHVVARHWQLDFEFRTGSAIGTEAEKDHGVALTQEVIDFCESLFADGGALLCGPGGSRFVYDLRARFDLFCKITPIQPIAALQDTGILKPAAVESVDMLVVRENVGGLYFDQGQLSEDGATHSFRYSNKDVQRILEVAIRLAQLRRGRLALAVKPGAVKAVSQLWMDAFEGLTSGQGLSTTVLEIDNAAYQIIAAAPEFDVVVAPNMFGDILSDGAALLLSSRGLSFSGNFASSGAAVYQTGHGAARDLAGKNKANPIGQIKSATFMLRESFGLLEQAAAIEAAVEQTVAEGIRTADIATVGSQIVGTSEMGQHIVATLEASLTRMSVAS